MIYLLKPKYNNLFVCDSEEEANEIISSEGGMFKRFNYEPTEEERHRAFLEYYM